MANKATVKAGHQIKVAGFIWNPRSSEWLKPADFTAAKKNDGIIENAYGFGDPSKIGMLEPGTYFISSIGIAEPGKRHKCSVAVLKVKTADGGKTAEFEVEPNVDPHTLSRESDFRDGICHCVFEKYAKAGMEEKIKDVAGKVEGNVVIKVRGNKK